MNKLKVCFVGIGSIAKRHIVNFSEICLDKGINLTVDTLRRSAGVLDTDIAGRIRHIFVDGDVLPNDYDVIFLTNPTDFHLDVLQELHCHAKHFFIEKPLTSYNKLEGVFNIKYREDSIYYVACPLRYMGVIQYLHDNIDVSDVISVRCISSSYLPDWRPGTDYRSSYSASKELGGGVSIDLIHEWDYISYLFGSPNHIHYAYGKKSSLELECEDYAIYVADYPDKIIELHLDYFGRKTIREIMIFTNEDTILGDLVKSEVTYMKSGKEISFAESRDDYQKRELMHFLDIMDGKTECDNGISKAYQTMQFTQGVVG